MPSAAKQTPSRAGTADISPIEADAAMATITEPRQAIRREIECSGGPGLLALRIASIGLIVNRQRVRALSKREGLTVTPPEQIDGRHRVCPSRVTRPGPNALR